MKISKCIHLFIILIIIYHHHYLFKISFHKQNIYRSNNFQVSNHQYHHYLSFIYSSVHLYSLVIIITTILQYHGSPVSQLLFISLLLYMLSSWPHINKPYIIDDGPIPLHISTMIISHNDNGPKYRNDMGMILSPGLIYLISSYYYITLLFY